MWLLKMGLLNVEYYLGGGFFQAHTFLLFHEGYTSIEECKEITSLVGVLCMKRRKMEALFESFFERERRKRLIQRRCSEK
jgi:hypothetical protein